MPAENRLSNRFLGHGSALSIILTIVETIAIALLIKFGGAKEYKMGSEKNSFLNHHQSSTQVQ
ncbi:hypothetical protein [Umezakia ovalisporum]|jgi:hypothetical protein|uniref:Uncharacterized protein n=2 Tax=Umezakia ovalisporum TaxID=75695 RepID=A0AA43GVC7_9CYAN|nr:hypothetical protein [Umezakia ovalisporum]MBI1241704.1 hypothetical protein [Nostoc sp. RI_552]MDH6055772.1 hypothetical protein [Umezakia ovalisporum FSS-43]MDH6062304.1 hypothetical protein [Umezakia ovalisporum FSS-62]MDH6067902.1 hypothetical protein [Umezakia ovalisporum APH033B]MDH6071096.1 hypothetical protein [Umezakia ovalisporum CobakiLakeA]